MKNIILNIVILLNFSYSAVYLVPDDFNSIQLAIEESSSGDTVIVSPGQYFENIDFLGKEILVTSLFEINNDSTLLGLTIIDASGVGSVVTFKNNETNNSVLQGFTLQNGTGNSEDPDDNGSFYTYGGGIYCEESNPIIKNCIIQNNSADQGGGGGIFCYNSSPKINSSLISNNITDDVGGGLYTRENSNPELNSCIFEENSAEFGGGCYLRNESTPVMNNVVFRNNLASNSGGGISLKDNADLIGNYLEIIENEAEGLGGGLYVNNADPELSFILIGDNLSSSGGGGYIRNNSSVYFLNATIVNNSAGLYGEGLYLRDNSNLIFNNSIIWDNGSSQIYFRSNGEEVQVDISYSLVQDLQNGIIVNDNGTIIWGDGNFNEEPYFCNASMGNYSIRENSPCIYGGENGALVGCFNSGCGPINSGPVWYIDSSGDDDNDGSQEAPFATIEKAVSISVDGDTIRLNEGVYTETVDFEYKNLVLESMAFFLENMLHIEETSFGPGIVGGSCFSLIGPSNNNAKIRGLSFRGGSEPNGGGVVISDCSPKFEDVIIENNNAEIGGGVYLSESDSEFINCKIRNNGANLGGGIYISSGNPLFVNLNLENNIAYWGGGIYSQNSNLNILYSNIIDNEAFIEGGALYQNGGIAEIEWTSFLENKGYDYGGGIVVNLATTNLNQITFAGNESGIGSAISMNSSDVTISNSILWNNFGSLFYSPPESGVTSLGVSFTNIEGGIIEIEYINSILLSTQDTIYNVDPQFCDVNQSSYGLQEISECNDLSDSGEILGSLIQSCEETLYNQSDIVTSQFKLYQNYPNPFNPLTNITFFVQNEGVYDLSIFDLRGNLIITLFDGFKSPGAYSVIWDSKNARGYNMPSGAYIYRLKSINQNKTKKMILVK